MATFHFDLVSPEKLAFSGAVDQVDIPGVEGDFGVLAGHAPVVAAIRPAVEATKGMAGDPVENAVTAHVRQTVDALKASGPVLADAVAKGARIVSGGAARTDLGGRFFAPTLIAAAARPRT